MTALRVALVAEHYRPRVGGIELHVQALARHLLDDGMDVHIITTYPGPDHVDGVEVHRFPVPLLPVWKSAFTPAGIAPVRRLFESRRFDVVHTHPSVYSPAVLASTHAAQAAGVPTVATFHSHLSGYTAAYSLLDSLCGWTRWPVVFSAVSHAIADELKVLVDGRKVAVLPNGLDATPWRTERASDRAVTGVIRFVTTMRLAPRKRPRALIDIFAAVHGTLAATGRSAELHIIGDGPERKAMQRIIDARGLADVVQVHGALSHDEIRLEYRDSHVFVLPSVQESFGIAALEARAAGLPVVAMKSSGAAEFIGHGMNGLLAETDTDFADAMVSLAVQDVTRDEMAERNRTSTLPFDWSSVIADHRDAYHAASQMTR